MGIMKTRKNYGIVTLALFTLISLISISSVMAQSTLRVHYLPPDGELGHETDYYLDLLRLALEKTVDSHGPFELVPSAEATEQVEALRLMRMGGNMDVIPTMTDRNRERVFIPVRVPLVKGLIGVRLMMINEDDAGRWNNVRDLEDLKAFTFGQGRNWPDTQILSASGLNVLPTDGYFELFDILKSRQVDGFPRAAFEIWDEIDMREGFSVADGFYIHYPTAMYFFTRRDAEGRDLADRLEAGLNNAINDGSFDELFNAEMGEFLERSNLNSRRAIRIPNPLIPETLPVDDSRYWYIRP